MNGYLKPPVFWAMISFACLLFLACVFAGPFWAPWVLGVVIAATVVEWAIEQNWLDETQLTWLHWRLGWVDGDLQSVAEQLAEDRAAHEHGEMFALRVYYTSRVKDRQSLRMKIADLEYQLHGAVEGVDYPRL